MGTAEIESWPSQDASTTPPPESAESPPWPTEPPAAGSADADTWPTTPPERGDEPIQPSEVEAYPAAAVAAAADESRLTPRTPPPLRRRMLSRPARRRSARAPSARAAAPRIDPAWPSVATAASGWLPPESRARSSAPAPRRARWPVRAAAPTIAPASPSARTAARTCAPSPPATCRRRWSGGEPSAETVEVGRRGAVLGPVVLLIGLVGIVTGYLLPFLYGSGSLFERAWGADGYGVAFWTAYPDVGSD